MISHNAYSFSVKQALLVVLHKTDRIGDILNRTVNALLAEVNKGAEATIIPSACEGQISLSAAEVRISFTFLF